MAFIHNGQLVREVQFKKILNAINQNHNETKINQSSLSFKIGIDAKKAIVHVIMIQISRAMKKFRSYFIMINETLYAHTQKNEAWDNDSIPVHHAR